VLRDAVAAGRALLVARLGHVAGQQESRSDQLARRESTIDHQTIDVCEIECWRGYVKWQFHVKSPSPLEASFSSPYFRAVGGMAPEQTDAALRAHGALVEKLTAAGWERDGRGEDWFAERFQREAR
jgi:hypothetical protein